MVVVVLPLVLMSGFFESAAVVGGREGGSIKASQTKTKHVWLFIDTVPLQTPGYSGRKTPFVGPVDFLSDVALPISEVHQFGAPTHCTLAV